MSKIWNCSQGIWGKYIVYHETMKDNPNACFLNKEGKEAMLENDN